MSRPSLRTLCAILILITSIFVIRTPAKAQDNPLLWLPSDLKDVSLIYDGDAAFGKNGDLYVFDLNKKTIIKIAQNGDASILPAAFINDSGPEDGAGGQLTATTTCSFRSPRWGSSKNSLPTEPSLHLQGTQ